MVSDQENKIHIFSRSGQFIKTIGAMGKGPGEFMKISMSGSNEHNCFIYDARQSRLTIYSEDGNLIKTCPFDSPYLPLSMNIISITDSSILLPLYSANPDDSDATLHIFNWESEQFTKHLREEKLQFNSPADLTRNFHSVSLINESAVVITYAFANKIVVYDLKNDVAIKDFSLKAADKIRTQKEYMIDNFYFGPAALDEQYLYIFSINENHRGWYMFDKNSFAHIGFLDFPKAMVSADNIFYNLEESVLYKVEISEACVKKKASDIANMEIKPNYGETLIETISSQSKTSFDADYCKLCNNADHVSLFTFGGKKPVEYDAGTGVINPLPIKKVYMMSMCIGIKYHDSFYMTLRCVAPTHGLSRWDEEKGILEPVDDNIRNQFCFWGDSIIYHDVKTSTLYRKTGSSTEKIDFTHELSSKYGNVEDIKKSALSEVMIESNDNSLFLAYESQNKILILDKDFKITSVVKIPGIETDYMDPDKMTIKSVPSHKYCVTYQPRLIDFCVNDIKIYVASELIPGKVFVRDLSTGEENFINTKLKSVLSMTLRENELFVFGKMASGGYELQAIEIIP